jgi:hypothetical protein
MLRKSTLIVSTLILSMLFLSSCNLPSKQAIHTQTPTPTSKSSTMIDTPAHTTTPTSIPITSTNAPTPTAIPSLCDNLYFPNASGDTWEYAGNNTAIGAYTRTDTLSNSNNDSFTVQSKLSDVTYMVDYACTDAGLIALNPIQQYMGALLTSLNAQVNVNLLSNSGISLPAKISPGDTWQQIAEFEASSQDISTNGRLVFIYTAVGYENITVPFGTFDALRVDATIRIEIGGFRILAGTYETTTWMAPNVGIIKSVGTSHVPRVEFSDSMELTRFATSP